jgi:hypothetical protein
MRICLLKGCNKWFHPEKPSERYCSDDCRAEARKWSLWKAQVNYRSRQNGKDKRKNQCRDRRERIKKKKNSESAAVQDVPLSPAAVASLSATEEIRQLLQEEVSRREAKCGALEKELAAAEDGGEKKQVARVIATKFFGRPCDRPGCYELFNVNYRSPKQHFCSKECRRAVERVREREQQWKKAATRLVRKL